MGRLKNEAAVLPWIVPIPPVAPICRWCGKALKPQTTTNYENVEKPRATMRTVYDVGFKSHEEPWPEGTMDVSERRISRSFLGWGYGCNGSFCTLRCGFRWAVKQLRRGGGAR
jgi:hypothetical protein